MKRHKTSKYGQRQRMKGSEWDRFIQDILKRGLDYLDEMKKNLI